MKKIGFFIVNIFALSLPALAGNDTWRISTQDFYQIEQTNTSTKIVIGVKTGVTYLPIYNVDGVNPCNIDHLELVPPAGKDSRWMNLVLTAVSTGRDLIVYGDCNTISKTLTADASATAPGRITLSD